MGLLEGEGILHRESGFNFLTALLSAVQFRIVH
jgi:hypothetical protein